GCLGRLEDRVAQVDRVPKEDARVGVRDHAGDAGAPDSYRRDLAGGAAAKVRARHQDVAAGDPLGPAFVAGHALARVLSQLLLVERVDGVLGRDDLVGVHVVPDVPRPAVELGGRLADTGSFPT